MLSPPTAAAQLCARVAGFTGIMATADAWSTRPISRLRGLWTRIPTPRTVPFAYATVGLLLLASAWLHVFPNDVAAIVGWTSTNVHNLAHHPVAATFASAFIVPNGLLPELLIVGLAFVVVERAIGTARVVVIALTGHAVATIVTEGAVAVGIALSVFPSTHATRSDVGISYAMYAVGAAAVFLVPAPWRTAAVLALVGLVGGPVLISPDMTALGHALAATIGFALMWRLDPNPEASRLARSNSAAKTELGPVLGRAPRLPIDH